MKAKDYNISSEKFVLVSHDAKLHDKKLETKPVSYLKDAMSRFTKNKGSIVAAFVIAFLVLFAIIAPFCTPYTVSFEDITYKNVRPKNNLFVKAGIQFWDGGENKEINKQEYVICTAIETELGKDVIIGEAVEFEYEEMKQKKTLYAVRLDSYNRVGVEVKFLTDNQYKALQAYQDETGIQVIYPAVDETLRQIGKDYENDSADFWFKTKKGAGEKTEIVYDDDGKLIPVYKLSTVDNAGNHIPADEYDSLRVEGETPKYEYAIRVQGGWNVRVDYNEYFTYYHTVVLKDGIKKASFILGADASGSDILVCLASGARFSFILAIIVASFNLVVGAIYGAIEGYYGGKIDLMMERFSEILSSIPFMIVITLLKYHLSVSHMLLLFISFFLTGWVGMASRTRMQFYRFKNQEYVLVARTLGAKDSRIMFKHIFPNAIGTLITGSVLVIPGVIFSETSLSYLGIIDLNTGSMTSVGTLLAQGQNNLTNVNIIVWPALFISLLMLSFNLFGNGLRDAFNPSLRGTEE